MYAEMSPPLNGHIADYQSFFLSCKRLKAEAEIEVVRNMQHFLKDVKSTWDKTYGAPLRINIPIQVDQITHVEIGIPTSILQKPDTFARFPAAFALLPSLYIARLTFIFYDDKDGWEDITSFAHRERALGFFRFEDHLSDMVTRDMKLCLDNDTESPHASGSNVDEIRFIWEDSLKSVTSTSYSERAKGLGYMGAYELWYLRKSTSSRGIFGFFWKRKQP
ncbi:hypothetical protein J4E90_003740 [Alternaria incomplexa]|uniref:uncharacterized protein n=1 Tax=Alternaria incomplexa TaxID=1187928 RepID=UPI00221E5258|nr:uncharacterized protein J4E90_003740 [Alternaria incomplexa]XP_051298432.1 uncharacterized protein J4E86_010011 [Alternaria arbusti]KAI4917233.1 hypothetical protein J4E90_003740 [Alternaria incomplexa]KAI4943064.1 hypothetical protein J4E86_010011 [Alternaria arbusti]